MPCSVLIVDDHAGFRARAQALLVAAGYQVVGEAPDGKAGVTMARDLSPELMLLDVQLPDISGFEVARRVRSQPDPPAIVLISSRDGSDYYLMSAFASPFPLADPFAYLLWELQGVLQISVPIVFLWGLLSARLARSAVGDLVVELERPLPPGELQAALARTLGDPSLALLYTLESQERWVDASGQQQPLPAPGNGNQQRAVTLAERDGRPLAVLVRDPALDEGLVRAAAAAAGIAIENSRLHAEIMAQLEEVRASRQRIVEAGDRERRRIERNLQPERSSGWPRCPSRWPCCATATAPTPRRPPRSPRPPPS